MDLNENEIGTLMTQLEVVPIGYALDPFELARKLTDETRDWGSYENQERLLLLLVKAIDEKMSDPDWSHRMRESLG